MTLTQMNYIITISETGSLNKAAEALYILIRKWLIITEFHAGSYPAWQCSRLLLHVAFL